MSEGWKTTPHSQGVLCFIIRLIHIPLPVANFSGERTMAIAKLWSASLIVVGTTMQITNENEATGSCRWNLLPRPLSFQWCVSVSFALFVVAIFNRYRRKKQHNQGIGI